MISYKRKNGLSKQHLQRSLTSIKNQTNQNFKLFLIGDKYEDEEEFFSFKDYLPQEQFTMINRPEAYERDRWKGYELWCTAPVTATNFGIDIILKEGFEYICHIDDDDYWLPDHIETLYKAIKDTGKDFIHTVCKIVRGYWESCLPDLSSDLYEEIIPKCEKLAKCSTCINYKNILVRPRNVFEETGTHLVYDCDLWNRIGESGEIGIKVNKVTVVNDDEKNIVKTEI